MKIAEPKNRKELRSFIGVVNYYRDMWIKRAHVLAPLAELTSKTKTWKWEERHRKAFAMAKKVMARETLLMYPDFSKPFQIHTDASHYQLGAVISQDGKPIAFYSRKLNSAQTRYTTTERELLSIVETLKEYRNILLGHEIEVFTDHQNLVYKHFNTERVMRWRLLLEEFGPKLTYIKGANNIVADALSRLGISEEEFSPEAFCAELEADFPKEYPLSYKEIAYRQEKDEELQRLFKNGNDEDWQKETFQFSDTKYSLITRKGKIYIPKGLQKKTVEWYHRELLHPGETRTELTIGQHYHWRGLQKTVEAVCKACTTCRQTKDIGKKYGKLPPKPEPEIQPWHTLCIDLIGPYKIGHNKKATTTRKAVKDEATLHALTMIDPATGWFEIVDISSKRADFIANYLEIQWLSRYPWPTEIIMDRGNEFKAEVQQMLHEHYGIKRKLITVRNPQANSMVERAHKTIHQIIDAQGLTGKKDLDKHFQWQGVLAAVRNAMRATVHTTLQATPTQLVFGRDAYLNTAFEADWQYIRDRKMRRIIQNNKAENAKRIDHEFKVGDKVMLRTGAQRKHGDNKYEGPYTLTQINDNGTVKLTKAAPGGAVTTTWNIRNLTPCLA